MLAAGRWWDPSPLTGVRADGARHVNRLDSVTTRERASSQVARSSATKERERERVSERRGALELTGYGGISGDAPRVRASKRDLSLPWHRAGHCFDIVDREKVARRDRYLATFIPHSTWHTTLYAHPDVVQSAIDVVERNLERVNGFATAQIGLASEPPLIFLYPSVDALRAYSCVNGAAVAYYDGAIHLAVGPEGALGELKTSLRHEYAHHVLTSNGIGKPTWFQEGTAMMFAHERPRGYWQLWRENPIHLNRMVDEFPTTAPLEVATVFYAQAYVMMEFLDRLCLTLPRCGPGELALALQSGRATPKTLFEWAVQQRGRDLFRTTHLTLWDDYQAHGNFLPKTYQALLERRGPHQR
jgi:hypothetical protein